MTPLIAFALLTSGSASTDWSRPGHFDVKVINETWTDATRSRDVPVRIYRPTGGASHPVVVFSHGLGGNVEAGEKWGRQWASWGFISVHIQHHGSDTDAIRVGTGNIVNRFKAAANSTQLMNRARDAAFAYTEIGRRTAAHDPALDGAIANDIGFSGHSFGAQTTLAVAGQHYPGGISLSDKRYRAFEAFSPGDWQRSNADQTYGGITAPFMSLTGSQDKTNINPLVTPENRRIPFEHMAPGNKSLVWLDTATHMSFGGQDTNQRVRAVLASALGSTGTPPDEAHIDKVVRAVSTAFWFAYLSPDSSLGREAKAWLASGPKSLLRPKDSWEVR